MTAYSLSKAWDAYQDDGFTRLSWRVASYAYKRGIRPLMPRLGWQRLAGIPVGIERRLGDRLVGPRLYHPIRRDDCVEYESGLVGAIAQHVRPGDAVVVVGGGCGVTVALAALASGDGEVVCFEGDAAGAAIVRQTAALNGVSGRVSTHHAVVASNIGVYGTEVASRIVMPRDLPSCDVLELDCEGAELEIIAAIEFCPRVILVETHGYLGASSFEVASALSGRGYDVTDFGWAEPRIEDACRTGDIKVLAGVQSPDRHRPASLSRDAGLLAPERLS